MTDSLCIVCKTNPKEFKIVDSVLVCCVDCNYKEENKDEVLDKPKGECLDCGLTIYFQHFNNKEEQCESCEGGM